MKEQLLKAPPYLLMEEQKQYRRKLQAVHRAKTFQTARLEDEVYCSTTPIDEDYQVKR